MKKGKITNMAASVRQRLLDKARADQRPFAELLQYYAMERFLYRLSLSPRADEFILKGALLQRVWCAPLERPTMDIDMLGKTGNRTALIEEITREICATAAPPDGIEFDLASIRAERITEGARYEGVRVRLSGKLGTAVVRLQIDIGFGDIVFPKPGLAEYPSLLDHPTAKLRCYSRESAIAEKFEAMVSLGELNSRMKDFYDIWLLARQFDFEMPILAEAIARTFRHRGTTVPDEVVAFTDAFINAKATQWHAFRKKLKQDLIPSDFATIVDTLKAFVEPVIRDVHSGQLKPGFWKAPGPWG